MPSILLLAFPTSCDTGSPSPCMLLCYLHVMLELLQNFAGSLHCALPGARPVGRYRYIYSCNSGLEPMSLPSAVYSYISRYSNLLSLCRVVTRISPRLSHHAQASAPRPPCQCQCQSRRPTTCFPAAPAEPVNLISKVSRTIASLAYCKY